MVLLTNVDIDSSPFLHAQGKNLILAELIILLSFLKKTCNQINLSRILSYVLEIYQQEDNRNLREQMPLKHIIQYLSFRTVIKVRNKRADTTKNKICLREGSPTNTTSTR